jgi:hypothetical protein
LRPFLKKLIIGLIGVLIMMTEAAVEVAIRTTVMDYVEGWYEGDAQRMNRCLHPRLAKRALKRSEPGLIDLTKDDMMGYTLAGEGREAPRNKLYYKINILDVYEGIAMARAESYEFIDYVQLVNENGHWLIMNVLYTANRSALK